MSFKALPEVFVSNATRTKQIYRYVQGQKIKKIGPKLYTKNIKDEPSNIIKKHLWSIVAAYYPDGLIADRTALEGKPAEDGSIYLISSKTKSVDLPGYTIIPRKGHKALSTDHTFIDGLMICSRERAILENMQPSRSRARTVSRTFTQEELEKYLEGLLQHSGESYLNTLRDKIRPIAEQLKEKGLYRRFDKLIGSLLGTKEGNLESDVWKARQRGLPFDEKRIDLLQSLYASLKKMPPSSRLRINPLPEAVINLAFYEAYFSNYIEGTEFLVTEAEEIIFNNKIIPQRSADSHDILGTYKLCLSITETQTFPTNEEAFLKLLKDYHATIMVARPEVHPGVFKQKANRAGNTHFVHPDKVEGTLIKGYPFLKSLTCPLHQAIFVMFLVSEVHPFSDGNGRLARVIMNLMLNLGKAYPVIIPTVYRNNYLTSLKALSNHGVTEPFIRVMEYAQEYTSKVPWHSLKEARQYLEESNAFLDPSVAELEGKRLMIL